MPDTTGGETPDRCPKCLCANCGGTLAEHTEGGCSCDDCMLSPDLACSLAEFKPEERIGYLAEQLAPLLSSHLNPAAERRCLAVAHVTHPALHDYDQQKETNRA